jgi:hypothetical protein
LREGRCNLVGNFVKSYKDYLLIEYFDSKLGIILEFLDKDTGRSVHREILGVNVKELILYKNTMLIVADQLQTGGNRFIACFNLDRLEYDWKKKISNSQGGFSAPYKGKMYYNGFRDSTLIIEISTGEMVFVDRKTDIVPIYRYDDCLSGEFIILDGVIYTDINK